MTPRPKERASAWGTSQVYVAHFALTDAGGGRFCAFDRLSRAALGLAGADARPFRVWLEDWSAQGAAKQALPMRLSASEGEVAVDLTLESAKDVVLHGDRGLSQKRAEPGSASHYYSLTRMLTTGTITVGSETFVVSGSTRSLARDDVGIQVLDHWQSPRDSTRYPSHWRLSVPPERLELEIRP